jgi:peroxiredoxin Q/BCP
VLREVGAIHAKPGDILPDIALPSTRGRPMSPAEFRGKKHVVLYFYPRNAAPFPELAGCTPEACGFRDRMQNIRDLDGTVMGVSRQIVEDQRAFSEEQMLNFVLLSDREGKLGKALGVPEVRGDKEVFWKRVTFVADRHGIIRHIYPDVKVEHHAEEILTTLLELQRRG